MQILPSPLFWRGVIPALFFFALVFSASAQRQTEALGRGLMVVRKTSTQAYVSWRLFATDPSDVGFNLYRSANGGAFVKLNSQPLTNTTDYLDAPTLTVTNAYYVVAVTNGVQQTPSAIAGLTANAPTRQYFPLPLTNVIGGLSPPYDVKFCWVGDFDGDGEYDFLVDRLTETATNALNQYLQAYKRDGTFLWQMDMGYNSTNQYTIEPGSSAIDVGHSDNVTVFDLDGDGKAEVIVRTAKGVVFPNGSVLNSVDNTTQYLSILDGLTGLEKARITVPNPWPADGPITGHMAVFYPDGVRPSVLLSAKNRRDDGGFQGLVTVWDYRDGVLAQRWSWNDQSYHSPEGHQIRLGDPNHDGKDDFIDIGYTLSGSGSPMFNVPELVHGDRFHLTDIDPDRPGMEMFIIQQNNNSLLATAIYDPSNGKMIKKWYSGGVSDVGRGLAGDFDPSHRGCEFFSTQPGVFDRKGSQIHYYKPFPPEAIWWDSDLTREFVATIGASAESPGIDKFNPSNPGTNSRVYTIYSEGVHQAYGGRPAFTGDILGDWREELVLVANDYSEIRIYTTTLPATNRIYTLMQNPQYRAQATAKGYVQSSYVDYYLGTQMEPPPVPPVSDARLAWRGGVNTNWDTGTANWFTNNLWLSNYTATTFNSNDTVLFGLAGSNAAPINLTGALQPGAVMVHSPGHYTFSGSGSLNGAMKLTKAGAGKLIFNNTNNFTGKTLVSEGGLVINGSLPASPVTVRGGIWLDGRLSGTGVVGAAVSCEPGGGIAPGAGSNAPGTLTLTSTLTLRNSLNDFDLSDDATGTTKTNDLLIVNGNLTLQGTNTFIINRLNTNLPTGTIYPLINYSGTLSGGLSNLAVSGLTGIPVALTNPPGQIALVVKAYRPPATITWTGGPGGNAWDLLTSTNWLNGTVKDQFAPNDTVRFNNTGSSNLTVNLSGSLICSNLTVDSTSNYIFAGSGAIGGTASLTKTNSGTLTINSANHTFTGKTTIAGGTLVVSELSGIGFPSPLGNPPGGSTNLILSGNATLRVTGEAFTDRGLTLNAGTNTLDVANAVDQLTIAGVITGSGALMKAGSGTLALNVNNTYTGPTFISGGTVSLGGGTANQYGLGVGPGGNGNTTVTLSNGTLVMYSDSGSYDQCYWNLVIPTNSTGTIYADDRVDLNGTLTGSGTLNLNVYYVRTELVGNWSAFTGQINVGSSSGDPGDFRIDNSFGYANATVNFGNYVSAYHVTGGTAVALGALSGGTVAKMSGVAWTVGAKNTDTTYAGSIYGNSLTKTGIGTLTLTGNTNTYTGATLISGGTLQIGSGGTAGTIGTGSITANATLAFNRSDAITDTNFAIITGSGALAKRGSGKLTLTKAHTYTGATLIEAGTLALEADGSLASSSNLIISAGTFFDVSARTSGDMTLASGKQISGFGTINGGFTIGSGAILSPGTNSIGTLTFSNGLTLAAGCTNVLEISKTPKTNDVAKVTGTATLGGALVVSNRAGTLAIGDSFRIINATAGLAGSFSAVSLPPLTTGLTWNRAGLTNFGIITVASNTPPTFTSATIVGTNLTLASSGGVPGAIFYLVTSTNVALPLAQWTPVLTNSFNSSGLATVNAAVTNSPPQKFFRLLVP